MSVSSIASKLHISKSTLYGYLRHRGVEVGPYNRPAQARPDSPADGNGDSRTATVLLWLRVENNNKFVRGKKRVKEGIEQYLHHHYAAKLRPSGQYQLKVPYRADGELSTGPWRTCFSTSLLKPICAIASPNRTPNSKARMTGPGKKAALKSVHCSIAPQTPSWPC